MAAQSVRLLYCYLREKWTTLEILERDEADVTDFPVRTYQCLSADAECVNRRCRLSGDDCRQTEDAQEPWFDE